jgi:hypothetical protein
MWNQVPKLFSQIFLRLQIISIEEMHSDFGETKSDTLQRIYDIYYLLNHPKSETVAKRSPDDLLITSHLLSRNRYACEVLFKIYILTISSVLYGNSQLIENVLQEGEQKLEHFNKLVNALQDENKHMDQIWRSCPSKNIRRYCKAKMIKWFLDMQVLLTRVLQRLFTSYRGPETDEELYILEQELNYIRYRAVPVELELIFAPYVDCEQDLIRFSCFMQKHYHIIFRIMQNMNAFVTSVVKDPSIKQVVNKYRETIQEDDSPLRMQIYGNALFASSPSMLPEEEHEELDYQRTVSSSWEDDDDDTYSHEPPNKRTKLR